MISKLVILSIFIMSLYSITTEPSSLSFPNPCPTNDTQIVKAAILGCQNDNYSKTASCMQDYIRVNYKGQYWSVMVKNNEDTPDSVSIWSVTSCIVKLDNFGNTYKRSYLAWSIRNYLNSTEVTEENDGESHGNPLMKLTSGLQGEHLDYWNNPSINRFSPNSHLTTNYPSNLRDNCEQWKADSVKNLFQYCDVASNQLAAQCVKQKIYNELDEYWGVYASTGTLSGISVTFSYCGRGFKGYGAYSRYFLVWSGF